jgi:hypothetical protein
VAVYPTNPPASFDYEYYPARQGATAQFCDEKFVEPGEDVFMTGLLVHHPGDTRMLPIIRVGNIAAFPDEPIQLRTGAERVVLVETRSIAGLSGSPVFVHFGDHRRSRDGKLWEMPDIPAGYIAGQNWLLGIMHGVYTSEGNDPDGIGDATGEPLNTGIGVVIPVERIHEILDHPTLKERRAALAKKRLL